jgi:hypothetical protein
MDNDRRTDDDTRPDYEAPELIVLASVQEATLQSIEGVTSPGFVVS